MRLNCSVVLWGGTLQTNIAGVCGEYSLCMDHTEFSPAQDGVFFPGLQCSGSWLPGALQGPCPKWALRFVHFPGLSCSGSRVLSKGTGLVGCVFCALPSSKLLRFLGTSQAHRLMCFVPFPGLSSSGGQVLGECTVPGELCILMTALVPAAQFPGCTMKATSVVCCVSPLGS